MARIRTPKAPLPRRAGHHRFVAGAAVQALFPVTGKSFARPVANRKHNRGAIRGAGNFPETREKLRVSKPTPYRWCLDTDPARNPGRGLPPRLAKSFVSSPVIAHEVGAHTPQSPSMFRAGRPRSSRHDDLINVAASQACGPGRVRAGQLHAHAAKLARGRRPLRTFARRIGTRVEAVPLQHHDNAAQDDAECVVLPG